MFFYPVERRILPIWCLSLIGVFRYGDILPISALSRLLMVRMKQSKVSRQFIINFNLTVSPFTFSEAIAWSYTCGSVMSHIMFYTSYRDHSSLLLVCFSNFAFSFLANDPFLCHQVVVIVFALTYVPLEVSTARKKKAMGTIRGAFRSFYY